MAKDMDSWTVCSHIICSNLKGITRSGCIYGCSGALEDGFSQKLFQVSLQHQAYLTSRCAAKMNAVRMPLG